MTQRKGYTIDLWRAVQAADTAMPGVQLGRFCIERGVPVSAVAEHLGVSRQTVYWWFTGSVKPRVKHEAQIREALEYFRHKTPA